MDKEFYEEFRKMISKRAADLASKQTEDPDEWTGTGLCSEAQADGVPCPDPSCSCDKCSRSDRRD